MTQRQREVNHGPTWHDVLGYLEEFRLATGRHCIIELASTVGKGPESRLYVRVVCWERWEGTKRVGEVGKGSVWPHTDHATMPSLLLKLFFDLDSHLAEREHKALRQASF